MRIVERWRRGEETRTFVTTWKSLSVEVKGCSFECTSHMLPSLNTDKSCWLRLVKPVQCVLEPPCIFLRQEICPESSTHCAETCSHHCTPSSRHMINGRPGKIQQKSLESPWSTVLYGSKQLVNSILVWKEKTVTLTVAYSKSNKCTSLKDNWTNHSDNTHLHYYCGVQWCKMDVLQWTMFLSRFGLKIIVLNDRWYVLLTLF